MAATGGADNIPPTSEQDEAENNGNYDCNICLDMAKDSVVTYCGHLFW